MNRFAWAIGVALAGFSGIALAQEPDTPVALGWHWYTEPPKVVEEETPPAEPAAASPAFGQLTPTQQLQALQQVIKQRLDTAILYPTTANIAAYLSAQNYFTDQASLFAQGFERAQLEHPDLDYNLKYSHYNNIAHLQKDKDKRLKQQAIADLGQQYGLFVFYRGGEPIDVKTAEVVGSFAQANGVSVLPVHVDGIAAPGIVGSRPDLGQSAKMKIRNFPAVFLISPSTGEFKPLAFGFMSQDDLARRFLNVASQFKPNS